MPSDAAVGLQQKSDTFRIEEHKRHTEDSMARKKAPNHWYTYKK